MAARAWHGLAYAPIRRPQLVAGGTALACHFGVLIDALFVDGGIDLGLAQVACAIAWVRAAPSVAGSRASR